ncbi:MAG: hypothetical protein R3E95_15675 [Thiolinea sp.]
MQLTVIMPMPLHNLLSFHYRQARLQNARALPQRIYRMSHNRRAIPAAHTVAASTVRQRTRQQHSNDANPLQRIPVSHNRDLHPVPPVSVASAVRTPIVIEGIAAIKAPFPEPPVIHSKVATRSKNTSKAPEHPQTSARYPAVNIARELEKRVQQEEAALLHKLEHTTLPAPSRLQDVGTAAQLPAPAIPDPIMTKPRAATPDQPRPHQRIVRQPRHRPVWRPGHGSIEKVDKLTGEIVHLVETA